MTLSSLYFFIYFGQTDFLFLCKYVRQKRRHNIVWIVLTSCKHTTVRVLLAMLPSLNNKISCHPSRFWHHKKRKNKFWDFRHSTAGRTVWRKPWEKTWCQTEVLEMALEKKSRLTQSIVILKLPVNQGFQVLKLNYGKAIAGGLVA